MSCTAIGRSRSSRKDSATVATRAPQWCYNTVSSLSKREDEKRGRLRSVRIHCSVGNSDGEMRLYGPPRGMLGLTSNDARERWFERACCDPDKYGLEKHPLLLQSREASLKRMPASDMSLVFLGTASCIPSSTRGVSSVALRMGADTWLFDAGEGTQIQIQRSAVRAMRIKKIFLTHSHGDHVFGLPGLLCLLGQGEANANIDSKMEKLDPVQIYGPRGIRMFIRTALQLSYSRVAIPYIVHELYDVPFLHGRYTRTEPKNPKVCCDESLAHGEQPGGCAIYPSSDGIFNVLTEGDFTVKAAPMQHTVPCVGYVVEEVSKVGSLNAEVLYKCVERNKDAIVADYQLSDYRKIYAKIKEGFRPNGSFTFPDGTEVFYNDIMEPTRSGRKVVILGDTCDSRTIAPIATGADVLIHEATNTYMKPFDLMKTFRSVERDTIFHGHSTPRMAGMFAKLIEARQLVLTHFSPRYKGSEDLASRASMLRIERQAQQAAGYMVHRVLAAWDLMTLQVLPIRLWQQYEAREIYLNGALEKEAEQYEARTIQSLWRRKRR